jgi:cation diffusion facilitator family transporter
LVNLGLTILKFLVGILTSSIALIAEGLHSGLDIVSSLITFFGIKIAQKPADKKHPYGHQRYEGLAGFVVALLLFISAFLILFEALKNILEKGTAARFSIWGIALMAASTIINELMARLKYSVGNRHSSLALIADAEHTRADVISSLAVLLGLALVKFYPSFDSFLAVLVALYIFYEAYGLGKETIDSLVDIANPELEEKIKKLLLADSFDFSDIKTRKIGADSFAEISLLCRPQASVNEVTELTKKLEQKLLGSFPELKQVSLQIKSREFSESVTRPKFWGRLRRHQGFKKIGPEKKGTRIAVPLENNDIAPDFGANEYLMVDLDSKGQTLKKMKIKNPYYQDGRASHGIKFIKSISADKVIVKSIGENARKNLKAQEVQLEIIPNDLHLKDLNYGQAENNQADKL